MKRSFKIFKKMIISALVLSLMLTFCACGSDGGQESGTFLSLLKDGSIQSDIEESFEESYYDKDELQQSIEAQVADYNGLAGAGKITLEKVEVKDSLALVKLNYAGAKDYADFNKVRFFVGTAAEAEGAGYDLNVVLSSVKDAGETIGKADILALGDEKLLVADINEEIKLSGKAIYASDNAVVASDGKTVKRVEGGEGPVYVVYK